MSGIMTYPFEHRIKVHSYHLDSFGHVNNAVYFNYLEEARCDYMEQRGLSFNSFREWQAFPFVVSAEIRYRSPATYGDVLNVRAAFSSMRRTSFALDYEIYNETTEQLCATASMSFGFVDADGKITPIPALFREKMMLI
ncbi:acyl-CoA thioesterase [candidate division KSB1 bacterium]|nr:acyl-CoA thioesterase [candidate division KSB1 bacterium]